MENEGLITQEDIDMISKNSAAGDFEKKEEMKSLSGGAAAGGPAIHTHPRNNDKGN